MSVEPLGRQALSCAQTDDLLDLGPELGGGTLAGWAAISGPSLQLISLDDGAEDPGAESPQSCADGTPVPVESADPPPDLALEIERELAADIPAVANEPIELDETAWSTIPAETQPPRAPSEPPDPRMVARIVFRPTRSRQVSKFRTGRYMTINPAVRSPVVRLVLGAARLARRVWRALRERMARPRSAPQER